RCDHCVATRPAALTLRSGPHRVEYEEAALAALPAALRTALLASSSRAQPIPAAASAAQPSSSWKRRPGNRST
ncbi:MAG TPA: hypothetical protein VNC80_10890, partial [Mycobacteriales bacterium]|nr:hypothetical protein [Mycobacteriales bacterium]